MPSVPEELNERLRPTMAVELFDTEKCHPSRYGGTMPAQLPVAAKPAAVIGGGVLGSSWTWYGLP
jgi:hypothetical protein